MQKRKIKRFIKEVYYGEKEWLTDGIIDVIPNRICIEGLRHVPPSLTNTTAYSLIITNVYFFYR